jgi:4-amino-4-deoxy-L-arabinose transferase-like glycosyltransferase
MHSIGRWGLVLAVSALLALPLSRIFEYPHRISVLPSLQVDAVTYDSIGLDLANRRTIDAIPPLQPPGFVTFLGLIYTIVGHSWIAAKVALWTMLVCVTLMAGWLARRMYDSSAAGWIAALLCASSPALGWYTQTIQYELLAALFVIGLVMLVTVGASWRGRAITTRRLITFGVVVGAATVTREVLGVLIPIVALAAALRVRSTAGSRAAWRAGAIVVLIAATMVGGWSVAQSVRTGRPVTLSDKGPAVLMFGNNPHANGTFNAGLAGVGTPSGVAFIRAEPRQAAWLALRKVLYFWGVLRDGWNVPRPAALWAVRATGGWMPLEFLLPWARGGWILAALIVTLLVWSRSMWRAWWTIPAAIVLVMNVHVLTVSSHRFAVPVLPLAFAAIAGPLARLMLTVWRRPLWRASALVLLLAIAGMQLRAWPLVYHLHAAEMDGALADSSYDASAGETVRIAGTAAGVRPVLLLADEALPSGSFDLRITMRLEERAPPGIGTALRVTVAALDGRLACMHEVSAGSIDTTYGMLSLPCSLDRSSPVTLIVETLAVAPLRLRDVTLTWSH